MIENIVLSCHLSETNYGASASPDAYAIDTYIIPNRFQDNLHLVVSLYKWSIYMAYKVNMA